MDWHFKGKEFASGLTNLSVEKILRAKLCKCTKKLTSSAELNCREVKDHCRLRNLNPRALLDHAHFFISFFIVFGSEIWKLLVDLRHYYCE